ncbi:hypothetical protein V6259_12755 [Marinomonas sp. TI.3.20]|uniref:DUF5983 family protein n=1 Tax=Marinomonas sp. TI.3.20 TaxID=3121296 RepID=UPI00311FB359
MNNSTTIEELKNSRDSYRTLGISTAHFRHSDILALSDIALDNQMISERDTGFFIKLYSDDEPLLGDITISDDFHSVIKVIFAAGFGHIEIDCDANTYENLPLYIDGTDDIEERPAAMTNVELMNDDFPAFQAKIMTANDKGVTHDCQGTIDSNPDRMTYTIEPIKCEVGDFLEVFLASSHGVDFCSDGVHLIDIGGSRMDLSTGCVLSISHFEWLDIKIAAARREIQKSTESALAKLLTNN